MSQLCPRCQTVQPQENRQCPECGMALPTPARLGAPAFRFAPPVLLAEEVPPLPPAPGPPPEAFLPTVLLTEANIPGMHPPQASEETPQVAAPEAAPVGTPPVQDKRPTSWRLPALSALAILALLGFTLAGAAHRVLQAKQAAASRAATSAASAPLSPLTAATQPSALPLTVLLQSAAAGHHIPVGSPVVITAFAMLAPGQSAALSLSCKPARGRKTMFSFAEGRLCSARWTPSAPGRYQFTATALDDQCHSAAAHPLWITVDGPTLTAHAQPAPVVPAAVAPLPVLPLPVLPMSVQPLPIVKISPSVSEWYAPRALRVARRHRKPRVLAALPASPISSGPVYSGPISSALISAGAVRAPTLYHVVAASFRLPGNAAILARALRARGLFAVTDHQRVKHGKIAYLVEVGAYPLPDEAEKKTLELQRRGYPAYVQRLSANPVSPQ